MSNNVCIFALSNKKKLIVQTHQIKTVMGRRQFKEQGDWVSVYKKGEDGEYYFISQIEDDISVSDIENMDDDEFEDFLQEHELI